MVKKIINVEVKTSLQLLFKTRKINFKYPKGYKLSTKKEIDKTSSKHSDGNKGKAKSYNSSFANTSQLQTQAFKKKKYYESHQDSHPTTMINAIKIVKKDKDKDKAKNLSYIKYYTY